MVENLEGEIWKDIQGYEGLYQVSNMGRIKSLNYLRKGTEEILSLATNHNGYLVFNLGKNNTKRVSRIVAETFCDINNIKRINENDDSRIEVNHINEDKLDNRACNLEWCTQKYNLAYGSHNERAYSTKLKNGSFEKALNKAHESNRKKIYQYSIDCELIKIWDSLTSVNQNFCSIRSNHIDGKHKVKGYLWSYETLDNIDIDNMITIKSNIRNTKVYQYNEQGKLVKTYNKLKDVENVFGKNRKTTICACCNQRINTAFGFVFSYEELSKEQIIKRFDKKYSNYRWNSYKNLDK